VVPSASANPSADPRAGADPSASASAGPSAGATASATAADDYFGAWQPAVEPYGIDRREFVRRETRQPVAVRIGVGVGLDPPAGVVGG
jgi:hypothetical protein